MTVSRRQFLGMSVGAAALVGFERTAARESVFATPINREAGTAPRQSMHRDFPMTARGECELRSS